LNDALLMTGWLPYLIVLPLLILIQQLMPRWLGLPARIGDENGYVECGGRPDPYAPGQFLRVPLMAWLSRQAHRLSDEPENVLRSASSVVSLGCILISMLSAQLLGGPLAALLVGLLLTLMPGRIILSHHIWPDIWLGLWLSLACLILIYPDVPANLQALLLGSVAALAFLTRFDALLLAPFCGFSLMPLSLLHWTLVLLPTLVVFVFLSVRNARRYRIPWPDNTWMFNLMITAGETDHDQSGLVRVEQGIFEVSGNWKQISYQQRLTSSFASFRRILSRPVRAFKGVLTRAWASLGPDHFVLHRLLPPGGSAYPNIPAGLNRLLTIALTIGFPLFTAITVLALLVSKPTVPVFIWPTLAMVVGSLIHNRTRYRQAWLPGAALLLAAAMAQADIRALLLTAGAIPAWLIGIGLASALISFRVRPDIMEPQ
jgi:hypothetical protein